MFWKYGVVFLANTFLGPGVGQLILKQFKKGFVILGIAALILLLMSIVIVASVNPAVMNMDFNAMKALAGDLIEQNAGKLKIFNYALIAVWAYSYADIVMSAIAEHKKNESEKKEN